MKALLVPAPLRGRVALAVFLGRALLGTALAVHGWAKVQHLTSWAPDAMDLPAWIQAFAALGEFLGGILLALGLLHPIAALWTAAVMGGAVQFHMDAGDPWIAQEGGSYELALAYGVFCVVLFLTGPGGISLDQLLFKKAPAAPPPAEG